LGRSAERQLSGFPPEPQTWPNLVDPVYKPLLTDTGRQWNAIGFDEGANAEHSDGRLYIFTGDVATDQVRTPINADLVAWVSRSSMSAFGGKADISGRQSDVCF
jgi:hypothetical protein